MGRAWLLEWKNQVHWGNCAWDGGINRGRSRKKKDPSRQEEALATPANARGDQNDPHLILERAKRHRSPALALAIAVIVVAALIARRGTCSTGSISGSGGGGGGLVQLGKGHAEDGRHTIGLEAAS